MKIKLADQKGKAIIKKWLNVLHPTDQILAEIIDYEIVKENKKAIKIFGNKIIEDIKNGNDIIKIINNYIKY
jgi:hypothetical protein